MRSIAKAAAVGALVAPIVLGGAGLASAAPAHDGPAYEKSMNSANANGGSCTKVESGFTEDGKAYFHKVTRVAGPTGATGSGTGSHS
ncbi:hypothetical protein ABZV77_23920 [Streptomyces sp. NPDC004732]|uniref:hypothetical protein n=1 Tax=Streptomyces sp. NPDC004732 TaxID=3154290 RepID=UPI0033BB8DE7